MHIVKNLNPENLMAQACFGNHAKIQSKQKGERSKTSSTCKHINTARIDRLFLHLGAIYGHIWLSQFQNEGFLDLVKKEWGETLHGIEDRNLSLALDVCKQQETMPPTLPKFYRLCCSFKKTETPSEVEMTRDALIDVEHECAHWEKILTLASEKDQNNVIKNFQQFLSSAQQRRIKIKKQFNATQKPKKKTNNIGG